MVGSIVPRTNVGVLPSFDLGGSSFGADAVLAGIGDFVVLSIMDLRRKSEGTAQPSDYGPFARPIA